MSTEAERRVALAVLNLFPPDEQRPAGYFVDHSADGNLEAAIIDLENRGVDKVSIKTLKTVFEQLTAARSALTQPLDD